jgi:nicotinamide riboside kinase
VTAPRPPAHTALRIAIVGAESTGKTTLARALAQALPKALAPTAADAPHPPLPPPPGLGAAHPAPRVAWVPEWLRQWCAAHGRTPRADEQAAIATEQHARIGAAAASHDIVVCDTTALTTAVYSRLLFADRTLEGQAVALHREIDLTLVTALDLPWVADGHQRDGPHLREPVDAALRELLHAHPPGYTVVAGRGGQRLAQALAAVQAALPALSPQAAQGAWAADGATVATASTAAGRRGAPPLFTRLLGAAGRRAPDADAAPRWVCDCCVPEAEQALLRRRA